jgi:3-hydroxyacyl-CoA dehydrogenase
MATSMQNPVSLTRSGNVAVITIDNPPVNALSPGVPEGILDAIDSAVKDEDVEAIIMMGARDTFIAGADIKQLQLIATGKKVWTGLLSFLRTIEDCPKPLVMAIDGAALGGGLETAMAGHYRVVASRAQVGQPEVKLGLIPGAAGTQRLPRLVGPVKTADMCWRGDPISASEAVEFGIADKLVDGDLLACAISFAREMIGCPIRKTRDRTEKLAGVDFAAFHLAREEARRIKRGQNAPLDAIDAVEAATRLSFEDGCAYETSLFEKCLRSTEAKAMIHAFFSERTAAKIPDVSKSRPVREIKRTAVIGAGTMGSGIAMAYANAGIPVLLKETSPDVLDRGINAIRRNYAESVKKGRFSEQTAADRLALITPQLNYDGFADVDIVVEAVFESLELKKQVFDEIDRVANDSCILASNTSSLSIDEIAKATRHPDRVIGHHFFSPANVMPLLEVVRGKQTANAVIATSMALAKKLKKVAVLSGNAWGFIGNRMIHSYMREAEFLVEEGASVEQVDQALYDFGMPMGPLAMSDLAGIDVSWRIRGEHTKTGIGRPLIRAPLVLNRLYELGRFGQKTGAGWSKYDEKRTRIADPEVEALNRKTAQEAGIKQRKISDQEIVERCIYSLINEGARVLEEGIALRASDIDVVYLKGYGFPVWRGGPMFYADTIGLDQILLRLEDFSLQHGPEFWTPASLLKELVARRSSFTERDTERESVLK